LFIQLLTDGAEMPLSRIPSSNITVGIVTWNAESFIDATLAGVAAQDTQPDSVIVLDNGSSDSTVEKIDRWKSFLPIDLVSLNENLGISGGKRTVLDRVSTNYVAFLDHDDYWFPQHLSSALRHVNLETLVSPGALAWVEDGGRISRYTAEQAFQRAPRKQISECHQMMLSNPVFAGCVAPTDFLRDSGAFLSDDLYCCDYDAWIRFVIAGGIIQQRENPTVLYRNRPGSASRSSRRLIEDEIRMFEALRYDFPKAASQTQWENALILRRQHLRVITGEVGAAQGLAAAMREASISLLPEMTWRMIREVRRNLRLKRAGSSNG
jgi:glycosyltransferase involved in cell wall biosynthesis